MASEMIVNEVKALKAGWTLFSPLTNMPYVECEEENYFDQVYLFESKTEAEAAVERLEDDGIRTVLREMKTVSVEVPVNVQEPNGEKRQIFINQVRQHMTTLPFLGVNAICFKPEGKEAQTVELALVLPEDYEKKVEHNTAYQPNLQLTGMYLMQEARRKKEWVDMKRLQELDEEFSSNLVKAKLFVAVMPPEGKEQEQKLELKECKLPYLKHQNGDVFFPVFSDIWEFQKYAQGKRHLRPIQIPFADIQKFWVQDAKAYMLNPLGYSLPLGKEMIPRILAKFGVSDQPS